MELTKAYLELCEKSKRLAEFTIVYNGSNHSVHPFVVERFPSMLLWHKIFPVFKMKITSKRSVYYVGRMPLDLLKKFPTGGQFYRNASTIPFIFWKESIYVKRILNKLTPTNLKMSTGVKEYGIRFMAGQFY